jgi:hypothetical protein
VIDRYITTHGSETAATDTGGTGTTGEEKMIHLKRLCRYIGRALCARYGYKVFVMAYDGTVHHAWTYSECLSWASCYSDTVEIWDRHGRDVGMRWAA